MKSVKYISIILILILSASCSVKDNYKALSFFFDGVPDPADTLVIPESVIKELADNNRLVNDTLEQKVKRVLYHQPYVNKGCSKCHDRNSVGIMIMEEPDICYQCHDNFNNTYKFIHGPVEGGFCTTCHDPHQSSEGFLLKEPIHDLCLYCHIREDISPGKGHQARDNNACNDCHNPHGGINRLMLKIDEI
ncbi:MAG: cytochrome c3 family protein [Bacteroidales bacterium]|nr:cytochrome c3 family protein [Bacteroidales bacterium]